MDDDDGGGAPLLFVCRIRVGALRNGYSQLTHRGPGPGPGNERKNLWRVKGNHDGRDEDEWTKGEEFISYSSIIQELFFFRIYDFFRILFTATVNLLSLLPGACVCPECPGMVYC